MPYTMRISLPSYNAGTDTNLDHYALYADQDNILIKEYTRGSISLGTNAEGTITHNLGYIPFYLSYGSVTGFTIGTYTGTGWFLCSPSSAITVPPYGAFMDTSKLVLINSSSGTVPFEYFIFYDQEV